jgi:hypothetical protein
MAGNTVSKVAIPSRNAISRVDSAMKRTQLWGGGTHLSGSGPTQMLNVTPLGDDETESELVYWAKVVSATSDLEYTVDIYAEYDCSGTALATGQTLNLPADLHKFEEEFAADTVMPAIYRDSEFVAISVPIFTPADSTVYFLKAENGVLSWVEAAEFECPS